MDPVLKPNPAVQPPVPAHVDPGPGWQRRFWTIFGGQGLSLVGSALLGPLGGILADRYSRRALMIGADAISALCMMVLLALFLTDSVALWHVYVMMFIRSAMQAFQAPAAAASTALLVPMSSSRAPPASTSPSKAS